METNHQIKSGYALPPFFRKFLQETIPFLDIKFGEGEERKSSELPSYEKGNEVLPTELSNYDKISRKPSIGHLPQIFPLRMKLEQDIDFWELPFEPVISIKGKNVIVRRAVAKSKQRGTIKEYWTQDDYEITIVGYFINDEEANAYPTRQVERLRQICESGLVVQVQCEILSTFGITQMVIEDWDIPFTKGENIQAFALKCYSDDAFDLLVEDNVALT